MTTLPAWTNQLTKAPSLEKTVQPPLPKRSAVLGIGAYLPENVLNNVELERMVETSDSWIIERTGIRERRRVGEGENVITMGSIAGREAIARAGNPQIDAIVVSTCTPHTPLPAMACSIQSELGLNGVPAFDVNAACSGFVYGMVVADSLMRSGQARHVLLVASEAMTPLVDYDDRSTCVLFGDGAGAVVVGGTDGPGLLATRWGANGEEVDLICLRPNATGREVIHMAGRGTFRLAVEKLCAVSEELCTTAGWTISDIDVFIPHQANIRIIEATAKKLGLPTEKVFFNGDRTGNTSAASIPLAMYDADKAGKVRAHDRVLSVAFGAGTTWGGIALEWSL